MKKSKPKSRLAVSPPPRSAQIATFARVVAALPAAKPSQGKRRPVEQAEAEQLPACAGPDARTPPQFTILLRRPALVLPLIVGSVDIPLPPLSLGCVALPPPDGYEVFLGFDLRFEQVWNLTKLAIGDLSSTIGLAPSEQLTLEFQSSQRRLLEQSRVDSAEEMNSVESTTFDKEVMNVARSSSKTENWHVDGSGGLNIGIANIGASGGVQSNLTETSQGSLEHIRESTIKSARSLKTLHKIEVRGVTENIIQNRMTRVIRNPYPDRTLSINIFQLIKHFSIETSLAETRPALFLAIKHLDFDAEFVIAHADFLQSALLDQALIDQLPIALQGAQPFTPSNAGVRAVNAAKMALRYLFGGSGPERNVFNVPDLAVAGGASSNDPATSFNARLGVSAFGDLTGLTEALNNDLGLLFTVLNVFFTIYREMLAANVLDENAVDLALALAADAGPKLGDAKSAKRDDKLVLTNVFDEGQLSEVFRRLPGFLAVVEGMLKPATGALDAERKAQDEQRQAVLTLERLIKHLQCNENYYIQQFLSHLARTTNNQSIVDTVNRLADILTRTPQEHDTFNRAFDIERAFVDRQQIVIPAVSAISSSQLSRVGRTMGEPGRAAVSDLPPVTPVIIDDLEVPCDGVHLEVAKGLCHLDELPPAPADTLDLSIDKAQIKFQGS